MLLLGDQRQPEDFPPASYGFSYAVNDERTGDIKEHSETREGYVIRGSYSLFDPDGYKRTVIYAADNVNDFKAIVNRVPYTHNKAVDIGSTVLFRARTWLPLLTAPPVSTADFVKNNHNKILPESNLKSSLKSR